MERVSCKEVKDHMAEILNRVAYKHEKYKVARHNKDMAVIISVDEWEAIEKILQSLDDDGDIREAKIALKEINDKGSISISEMKKRVGL